MRYFEDIRDLVRRARARWLMLTLFQATTRAALAAAGVLIVAVVVSQLVTHWADRTPLVLALTGACALALTLAAILWGLAPLRQRPSDARVARFIEERAPSLDDRLVSAIDMVASGRHTQSPALAEPMLADAAARVRAVDLDTIVPSAALRRAGFQAAAAALLFAAVMFVARAPARQAYDAAALSLFPAHARLDVTPGNARVKAGSSLAIDARLVGNRAPVTPQVQIGDGENWRAAHMVRAANKDTDGAGRFRLALDSVTAPFKYRVVAGPVTSPTYAIAVAHPPRVTRIDVDYTFPAALGLKPRTEEDSGDIYAPAGTDVRVRIHTDRPAATGQMTLGDGKMLSLSADASTVLAARLKVVADNSYRVALADREGFSNPGETEYFIRLLEDRPPEVHIVKPASDRSVTRLEEVEIEAQADDDYGIERLDLVYSVRGGAEKAVPFSITPRASSVTSRRTLYLEELDVQPGEFVSYYVRARDLTRGKRPNEARSDLFFLEVKPFEQEFSLAQSQSMAGSGYSGSIDDLVNAQKAIVIATFKLDRRSQTAHGAPSAQDVRAIARAEADLKSRVEQTSGSFRESTMRDPRRRTPPRGRGAEPELRAGQTMPEEDAMTAAAEAMGRAVTSLDALKTAEALPRETEALSYLLKAQIDVKQRQVTRQQAGAGGPGNNNRNYDVSTLFDKELQRTQQTNYETQASAERKDDATTNTLDKIRDLARRQDELLKRQQQLARDREKMTENELKRELERLTRDQSELRQKMEELANSQQAKGQQANSQQSNSRQANSQQSKDTSGKMRDVSDDMRNAAGDLRRQDPAQASARGSRALEKLRDLERQLQAGGPGTDDRRRALGEMQLETRQLADAQRRVASEVAKTGQGDANASQDALRRLAGEQERLAERVKRLQQGLKQQAAGAASAGSKDKNAQAAVGDAARELERQRLAERMQQSADEMRAQAAAGDDKTRAEAARGAGTDRRAQAGSQQEMARALDTLADKLGGATGAKDDSRKLSEQLARAQELRDRLANTSREIQQLGQPHAKRGSASSPQKAPGDTGRSGRGESGGGQPGGADIARLRDEYARQLKETQDLMEQMQRQDPGFSRGGAGFTFQGQGMTLSAPGTEAFKQDFARWEDMRRQATTALDRAESSLSKKLQAQEAKDRLAAGVEDKAPPEYQKQVDSYFKALAAKKKQ
jgi:hypothetical protein